jgi:hypothetical protein
MATYETVAKRFWRDPKVKNWNPTAQRLALYLLTGPESTSEGFYILAPPVAQYDLQVTPEAWKQALATLEGYGFARFDPQTNTVFVCRALKYRPVSGRNSVLGALRPLEETHESPLFWDFLKAADRYSPQFAAGIRARYGIAEGACDGKTRTPQAPSKGPPCETPPSPSQTPSQTPSCPKTEEREDVARLCDLLADLIRQRDSKARVAPDSKRWHDAARLLLDRDGRSEKDVERVIRWCQTDDFWKANILSMPKLREKFDALWARAQTTAASDPQSTDDFLVALER